MATEQYLNEFDKFVSQQQIDQDEPATIDYRKEKEEWLDKIDEFYILVQEFINDYVDEGKIIKEWKTIQLQEDYFGEYGVTQLMLKIGKKRLIFKPIGRFVIGCNGRIDLNSELGTLRFVLVPQNLDEPETFFLSDISSKTKWCWKIVTPPPNVSYLEITKQTFFEALMEVVNA